MTREEKLLELIKLKYRSLRNFSIESNIANSTLSSMFKNGIGGTSVDTVLKVCSMVGCDIYMLDSKEAFANTDDYVLFSKYSRLSESSRELVRKVIDHQLIAEESSGIAASGREEKAKTISFPTERTLSVRTLKVFTNGASAGTGEYIDDSDYEICAVSDEIPLEADFGIAINGDSMVPQINDGDVVWVRSQDSLDENQIGVFVLNGNALCKKLVSYENKFYLRSLNPNYKDIPISEFDNLRVIGKVLLATAFPN